MPAIPPQGPPKISPQGPPKISPQGPPQSPPQSPLNSCSSPLLWTRLDEESSSEEEEDTATWQALPESESLPRYALDEKVAELVQFLLLKYQTKEPVPKAEMLTTVIKKYNDYFPMIFGKAHELIELIFGIGMPQNCLLILILSMISIKGSCVPEEVLCEVLSAIGVCAGREHFIYGNPRKLLIIDWVQRKYLEYWAVPNNAPPRYEFLWGPRAHSEASKRKVLKFLYHP
uniref:MAGE domain-containing protein n=1 Tax=Mandrillus leucophaeus TaxID=9568 RepID=A0A2K5YKR3_MANLE